MVITPLIVVESLGALAYEATAMTWDSTANYFRAILAKKGKQALVIYYYPVKNVEQVLSRLRMVPRNAPLAWRANTHKS